MSDNSKITHMQTTHEMYAKWKGNAFAGYDTKLSITKYEAWSEVTLSGGGRETNDWPIQRVPIEVLREIIKIHDQLPNP